MAPPTDPNVTHGNAAINRREYADLFAGDRKKKNTDALLIDEPNIIAAKMAAFDKFETDGAKFWRSMSKADPDGSDYAMLLSWRGLTFTEQKGRWLGAHT